MNLFFCSDSSNMGRRLHLMCVTRDVNLKTSDSQNTARSFLNAKCVDCRRPMKHLDICINERYFNGTPSRQTKIGSRNQELVINGIKLHWSKPEGRDFQVPVISRFEKSMAREIWITLNEHTVCLHGNKQLFICLDHRNYPAVKTFHMLVSYCISPVYNSNDL